MAKKVSTTIYITPEQQQLLKYLNEKTKVPVAEYIRQGIDMIIDKVEMEHGFFLTHEKISGS